CSKCGTKVRKECPNCKYVNNHKSDYCEKCGTKLN
ncbi:MAG: zinc ribbon domain-containing protein, partial [Clostridia bacterium]|nr:zinc ribbon domain-containing protein [Clostridia bacterium]